MKLQDLVKLIPQAVVLGDADTEISGISNHSQRIQAGDLFVCISGIAGYQEDRHPYAPDAIEAGAAAVLAERKVDVDVPLVLVEDSRHALAILCNHFYGYPSNRLKLIGITGTNGKTTTAYMIETILNQAGHKTGLMGNIGTKIDGMLLETNINTQEPPVLQANLRRMADGGCDYAVMEVSSQGLHAGRVLGCSFRTAILTNITQDHLDYHGTMEQYIAAKGQLFTQLGSHDGSDTGIDRFAVLNADDQSSPVFRALTTAQVFTYGIHQHADVRAVDIRLSAQGTAFQAATYKGGIDIQLRMVGLFNVYNALAAITAALAEGLALETIRDGLAALSGVPGRMEIVDGGQPFLVLVDYAHTPDGLENVLQAVRAISCGRIITVFGCGGDRDRTKRPVMGGIAAEYSDYIIVTSDNPRSEPPERILTDIEAGIVSKDITPDRYQLLVDRSEAIQHAISMAQPEDIVLLAGKGHETYQIFREGTVHFDDREAAREAIRLMKDGNAWA